MRFFSVSLKRALRLITVTTLISALIGCGFALRGNVEIPLDAQHLDLVFNDDDENLDFSRQFLFVAQQNGIKFGPDSPYQIDVSRWNYKRISTTLDSNALVDEYTLHAEVIFNIAEGDQVLAKQLEAFAQRTFQFDANAQAADNSRESIVSAELWRDISQQILRQYAARLKSK